MDAEQHGSATWRRTAGRVAAWTVTTVTLVGLGQSPTAAATVVPDGALVPVVVEGAVGAAADEVTRLGGVVDARTVLGDELQARVPAAGITALQQVDGVSAVTPGSPLVSLCEAWHHRGGARPDGTQEDSDPGGWWAPDR